MTAEYSLHVRYRPGALLDEQFYAVLRLHNEVLGEGYDETAAAAAMAAVANGVSDNDGER